jgi:hypothetical protein
MEPTPPAAPAQYRRGHGAGPAPCHVTMVRVTHTNVPRGRRRAPSNPGRGRRGGKQGSQGTRTCDHHCLVQFSTQAQRPVDHVVGNPGQPPPPAVAHQPSHVTRHTWHANRLVSFAALEYPRHPRARPTLREWANDPSHVPCTRREGSGNCRTRNSAHRRTNTRTHILTGAHIHAHTSCQPSQHSTSSTLVRRAPTWGSRTFKGEPGRNVAQGGCRGQRVLSKASKFTLHVTMVVHLHRRTGMSGTCRRSGWH